jgi:hypothetical protein
MTEILAAHAPEVTPGASSDGGRVIIASAAPER